MQDQYSKLASHLLSLYKGVPISDEAITKIEARKYDSKSSRFEIISNIDQDLLQCGEDLPKISGVAVNALPNEQFSIKFVSSLDVMPTPASDQMSATKNLKDLLKNLGLGTIVGPFTVPNTNQDNLNLEDEIKSELNDIELLNAVVSIIIMIERHVADLHTTAVQPVLEKYAKVLEERYIKPLLEL